MSGTEHAERFRQQEDGEDDPAALLPAVVVG